MASDKRNGSNGRNDLGQFVDGNTESPGRTPGMNLATLDVRRIRRSLIEAWDEVNATAKLVKLAKKNDEGFIQFCKIVALLLPRNVIEASGPVQVMVFNPSIHDAAAVKVADALKGDGHEGPITPELVRNTLHAMTLEKLNGNGSTVQRSGPIEDGDP